MSQHEPLDVKGRMGVLMIGVDFLLALDPVDDLIANIERTHAIAPFLDPTAYQRGMGNLDWQSDVLRAVQRFQRDLEPIRKMREEAVGEPIAAATPEDPK